jgi:processive 1,2-diacylglycerol beta-glucosyltransferase
MPRFLFLTAQFGTGHTAAAEALLEELKRRPENIDAAILDPLETAHPVFAKLLVHLYLFLLRYLPTLYRVIYRHTENKSIGALAKWLCRTFTMAGTGKHILRKNPDTIVCTHPISMQAAVRLRKAGKIRAKIVCVATDFSVHSFWMDHSVDEYMVASEKSRDILVQKGVDPNKIHVTGIPIRSCFARKGDKNLLLSKYGLFPGIPVVLVMGGGLGLGPIGRWIDAVDRSGANVQIVVVSGANRRLYRSLQSRKRRWSSRITVLSYVKEIDELMDIATVLITKPGAVTISEALAKSLPIFAHHPIPGQEEANLKILQEYGVLLPFAQGVETIAAWLADFELLESLKKRQQRVARPGAAATIIDLLLSGK